jgi:hypothetical protein
MNDMVNVMATWTEKCEKCGGSGSQSYEEDGRPVSDTCYRCSGSGRVDTETAHMTKLERVASIVGAAYVQGWRKSCNEDPEGEGWVFRAAENMMSEHDYTLAMTYEKAAEVGEELSKLSHFAQVALIEAILPKPKQVEEMPAVPATPERGSYDDCDVAGHANESDIPF